MKIPQKPYEPVHEEVPKPPLQQQRKDPLSRPAPEVPVLSPEQKKTLPLKEQLTILEKRLKGLRIQAERFGDLPAMVRDFVRQIAASERSKVATERKIESERDKIECQYSYRTLKFKRRNDVRLAAKEEVDKDKFEQAKKNKVRSLIRFNRIFEQESQHITNECRLKIDPEDDLVPDLLQKFSQPNLQEEPLYPRFHPQKEIILASPVFLGQTLEQIKLTLETQISTAKLEKPVGEIIISLPPLGDKKKITKEQAAYCALRQMTRLGIDPAQHDYMVIEHSNRKHQHFHVIYRRGRMDGGYHHIFGADHVCHLEAAIQDKLGGHMSSIMPMIAYTATSAKNQEKISKNQLFAEIRYLGKMEKIATTGPEANERLSQLIAEPLLAGGGLAKHRIMPSFDALHYLG
jgi:hypothetical protein